jgi:hypothetical protein
MNPKRCFAGRWPWVLTTACCFVTTPSKVPMARGIATLLKAAVEKGKYDLILTGAQADDGAARWAACWRPCWIIPMPLWSIKSMWKATNSRWGVRSKAATRR